MTISFNYSIIISEDLVPNLKYASLRHAADLFPGKKVEVISTHDNQLVYRENNEASKVTALKVILVSIAWFTVIIPLIASFVAYFFLQANNFLLEKEYQLQERIKQLQSLENDLTEKTARIKELEEVQILNNNALKQIGEENQKLNGQIQNLNGQIQEVTTLNLTLQDNVSTLKNKLTTKIKNENKLITQEKWLETQIQQLEKQLLESSVSQQKLTNTLTNLKQQLSSNILLLDLSNTKVQLLDERNGAYQRAIEQLSTQKQNLESEIHTDQNSIFLQSLRQTIHALQDALKQMELNSIQLQKELSEARQINLTLQGQLKILQEEIHNISEQKLQLEKSTQTLSESFNNLQKELEIAQMKFEEEIKKRHELETKKLQDPDAFYFVGDEDKEPKISPEESWKKYISQYGQDLVAINTMTEKGLKDLQALNTEPLIFPEEATESVTLKAAASLVWGLQRIAANKHQSFIEGAFICEDENSRIFNYLNSIPKKYSRLCSHLTGFENRKIIGIDIYPDKDYFLPGSKKHILVMSFERAGKKWIFVKPEDHGTKSLHDLFHHSVGYVLSLGRLLFPSYFGSNEANGSRKERIPPFLTNFFKELAKKFPQLQSAVTIMGSGGHGEGIKAMNEAVEKLLTDIENNIVQCSKEDGAYADLILFSETLKVYDHRDQRVGQEVIVTKDERSQSC